VPAVVLIVEDDAFTRDVLEITLKDAGRHRGGYLMTPPHTPTANATRESIHESFQESEF